MEQIVTYSPIENIIKEIKKGGMHSIILYPLPILEMDSLLKILDHEFKDYSRPKRFFQDWKNNFRNWSDKLYSIEFDPRDKDMSYMSYKDDKELKETKEWIANSHYKNWAPLTTKQPQLYSDIWS